MHPSPTTHRVAQLPLLLQVPKAAVNDGPHGAAGLGAGGHQAAVERVGRPLRARHEHDGAGGDRVDLVSGRMDAVAIRTMVSAGARALLGGSI